MIAVAGLCGLAALVALVFRAATVAMPLFLAFTVGRLCVEAGAGPVAAIALGALSGVAAHTLARGVFASARSDVTRSVVLVTPAAFAGSEVAVALARLGGMSGSWPVACGGLGALGTGFAALRSLAAPVPVAPALPVG